MCYDAKKYCSVIVLALVDIGLHALEVRHSLGSSKKVGPTYLSKATMIIHQGVLREVSGRIYTPRQSPRQTHCLVDDHNFSTYFHRVGIAPALI